MSGLLQARKQLVSQQAMQSAGLLGQIAVLDGSVSGKAIGRQDMTQGSTWIVHEAPNQDRMDLVGMLAKNLSQVGQHNWRLDWRNNGPHSTVAEQEVRVVYKIAAVEASEMKLFLRQVQRTEEDEQMLA